MNGANRFLRSALTSGGLDGTDSHTHDVNAAYSGVQVEAGGSGFALDSGTVMTNTATNIPPNCEVVWVIRVK